MVLVIFTLIVIKKNLGIIAGVVTAVIIIILAIAIVFFICKKKSDKPEILVPNERDSDQGKSIIFFKNNELKNNVVESTNHEQNRLQEFQKLEVKVAESITPVKMTNISREEDNAKHNRYKDIGKSFNKDLEVSTVHF